MPISRRPTSAKTGRVSTKAKARRSQNANQSITYRDGANKKSMKMESFVASGYPVVSAAKTDPPPVSTGKTLWHKRKVRIVKKIEPGATILVDDVKAQFSGAPFKCVKIEAWMPGRSSCEFILGDGTWINDSSLKITYTDIAPAGRMPGVKFRIPDELAEVMNTGSTVVVGGVPLGTTDGFPGGIFVADVTVMYQY